MRKWYLELHDVNTDLIRGYNIRCKNHQELLDALKQLNVIIQKAAQLRGKYSLYLRVQFCQPKQHSDTLSGVSITFAHIYNKAFCRFSVVKRNLCGGGARSMETKFPYV